MKFSAEFADSITLFYSTHSRMKKEKEHSLLIKCIVAVKTDTLLLLVLLEEKNLKSLMMASIPQSNSIFRFSLIARIEFYHLIFSFPLHREIDEWYSAILQAIENYKKIKADEREKRLSGNLNPQPSYRFLFFGQLNSFFVILFLNEIFSRFLMHPDHHQKWRP